MYPQVTHIVKINPEQVQQEVYVNADLPNLDRLFDFQVAYDNHVREHGVDRLGAAPKFTFTVSPGLVIEVAGY